MNVPPRFLGVDLRPRLMNQLAASGVCFSCLRRGYAGVLLVADSSSIPGSGNCALFGPDWAVQNHFICSFRLYTHVLVRGNREGLGEYPKRCWWSYRLALELL